MDLAAVHQELVHELRYGLGYVLEPARMAQLGDTFDRYAAQFEALGLCHLFEFADQARFRLNLVRSGHSRRFFLRRSQREANSSDRHLALSRTRAFLDALVAGSLPLARDIASLSIDKWNPEWEYEDDFCFYLMLHTIATRAGPVPAGEACPLLDRFERSLEGGKSAHFDISKALVAGDADAFVEALGALVEAEQVQIEKQRSSATVHEGDILFWPKSRISIDGLALLKIAELVGLRVEVDFPLCPALARLSWTEETFRDLFVEIEQLG